MYANLLKLKKNSMIAQTNKPDKRVSFKPFEPNKIVWQKSQHSAIRLGCLCCVNIGYIFSVAVTKIAKCVMIVQSLCAVPAYWAMVTQINCEIVGDRVYSVVLLKFANFVTYHIRLPVW